MIDIDPYLLEEAQGFVDELRLLLYYALRSRLGETLGPGQVDQMDLQGGEGMQTCGKGDMETLLCCCGMIWTRKEKEQPSHFGGSLADGTQEVENRIVSSHHVCMYGPWTRPSWSHPLPASPRGRS